MPMSISQNKLNAHAILMQELDGTLYQKLPRGFAQPEVVYPVPYPTRGAG